MAPTHRVLLYTACYNVLDGVSLTIRKIEDEILKAGHFVLILTTRSGDIKNTHMNGEHDNRQVVFLDNSLEIPFVKDPENPLISYHFGLSISRNTEEKIERFRPTIIHITVPDCINMKLTQYAREKSIPIMATYHSNIPEYMDHYPYLGWLKHMLGQAFRHQYNFMQTVYVPTPFIVKHLEDSWQMHRVTDLKVWGRGINLDKFNPRHKSPEWRRFVLPEEKKEDTPILLWVGRFVPEKRIDIFCRIVKELTKRNLSFHAVVIGAGHARAEFEKLPNTTNLGWRTPEMLQVAYASSDVFLFPSAVETFGNVTLEAAASGLPLVVEKGCSGHLVRHGINGYACKTYKDFLEGTKDLLLSAERRRKFSDASRQHSLRYEQTAVFRKMLDNYESVTAEFYGKYGGNYAKRDAMLRKDPTAFVAGYHPAPFFLLLVINVLCYIITKIWFVAIFILGIQRRMTRSIQGTSDEDEDEEEDTEIDDTQEKVVITNNGERPKPLVESSSYEEINSEDPDDDSASTDGSGSNQSPLPFDGATSSAWFSLAMRITPSGIEATAKDIGLRASPSFLQNHISRICHIISRIFCYFITVVVRNESSCRSLVSKGFEARERPAEDHEPLVIDDKKTN